MLLNRNIPPLTVKASRLGAIVLDWAGTTVDYGSLAPVRTLQRVFNNFGIGITEDQARLDMGIAKRDHVARILALPEIQKSWQRQYGSLPSPEDAEDIYQKFIPLQFACLTDYSKVIPGVPSVVAKLRHRGLKIGSTTGYTRYMLDMLVESSAAEGYSPDCSLSPEDVGAGRPKPYMIYAAAVRLQVSPMPAIVKVGDTVVDIEEALNAGCWAVGVAQTGNMVGLTHADFTALPKSAQAAQLAAARQALTEAGAHYVINTLADLEPVLNDIESRL